MNVERMKTLALALPNYPENTPSHAMKIPIQKGGHLFTVIGVMADIYINVTDLAYWEPFEMGYCSRFFMKSLPVEPWTMDVPDEVLAWYGVSRTESNKLWVASARGFSFKQIGEAIMRSLGNGRR